MERGAWLPCAFKSFNSRCLSELLLRDCSPLDVPLNKVLGLLLSRECRFGRCWSINLLNLIIMSNIAHFSLHSLRLSWSWSSICTCVILIATWILVMNIGLPQRRRRPCQHRLLLIHFLLPPIIIVATLREDFFLFISCILNHAYIIITWLPLIYSLGAVSPVHEVLVHLLLTVFGQHHFLIYVGEAENAECSLELLGVLVVGGGSLVCKVCESTDRVAVFVLHLVG